MLLQVKCLNNRPRKVKGEFVKEAICGRTLGLIDTSKEEFDYHYCRDCKCMWEIKRNGDKFEMSIHEGWRDLEVLEAKVNSYLMKIG